MRPIPGHGLSGNSRSGQPDTVTRVSESETSTPEPGTAEHAAVKHRVVAGERTIFFTDAVVAIAITLLALDLPLPSGVTSGEVWRSALEHSPEYRSFLISFLVIWALWSAHRQLFSHVTGGVDRLLSLLNGLWLLTIVVNPFATRVLSPKDDAFAIRFGFYAGLITLSAVLFLLMNLRIRRAGLVRPGTPPGLLREMAGRSFILACCFGVSIPVGLFTPWAYLCWLAAPVITNVVDWPLRRTKTA